MENPPNSPVLRRAGLSFLPFVVLLLLLLPTVLRVVVAGLKKAAPSNRGVKSLDSAVNAYLKGTVAHQDNPALTRSSWFSGDFQGQFGRWFGQNFALRAALVRTDNQIGYSLFHKSNMPSADILVGKNNVLYEGSYVREYCGINSPPVDTVSEQLAADLEDVGKRLQQRGIGFVVFISPSKPALYPENLPENYRARKNEQAKQIRGYDQVLQALKRHHVRTVDGHRILLDVKAAHPEDILFCQGGTHYSNLGMVYILRPLLEAIKAAGHKPIPAFTWELPVPVDFTPVGSDTDLAGLLNLWRSPTHFAAPHPQAVFDWSQAHPSTAGKLSLVGGSFCWQPLELLDENHVFSQIDFFYYYRLEHHRYPGGKFPDDESADKESASFAGSALEWHETFLKSDVIVLEMNETKLRETEDSHFRAFLRDAKTYLPRKQATEVSL